MSNKPGDIHTTEDGYAFLAVSDKGDRLGCSECIGGLDPDICDMLPLGCGAHKISWKPHNDNAKVLLAIYQLEGKI